MINKDDRVKTIGQKRNELMQAAVELNMTHIAFIDDDDLVSGDYIETIMPGVWNNFDCCNLIGNYYENGKLNEKPFIHSIKYIKWWEDSKYFYRCPNHLNVMKLSLVKDVPFEEKNFGEDGCWSELIASMGLLKTEYSSNNVIYHYLSRTKVNGI